VLKNKKSDHKGRLYPGRTGMSDLKTLVGFHSRKNGKNFKFAACKIASVQRLLNLRGLKSEDISFGARMFMVADVYDALTSESCLWSHRRSESTR
jgi:hypothetical protein